MVTGTELAGFLVRKPTHSGKAPSCRLGVRRLPYDELSEGVRYPDMVWRVLEAETPYSGNTVHLYSSRQPEGPEPGR
jgi:hypothetical protein